MEKRESSLRNTEYLRPRIGDDFQRETSFGSKSLGITWLEVGKLLMGRFGKFLFFF